MELIFGIIIGLIVLVILVVLHELGHAIVATRNGVKVEEFGIGFPPRAWKKKLKNGVLLSINWLPLGGFVRLKGEHDSAKGKNSYGAATFWQKTKILLAGVAVNYIVAIILFMVLAVTGMPRILSDQLLIDSDTKISHGKVVATDVIKNSPAEKAGIESGDKILKLDGADINRSNELVSLSSAKKGKTVKVEVLRGSEVKVVDVALGADSSKGKGHLGVKMGQSEFIHTTWSAPLVAVDTTVRLTGLTLKGLGELFYNFGSGIISQLSFDQNTRQAGANDIEKVSASVAGPVGILGVIFPKASQAGLTQLVFLAAIISLTLAIMNILPIPALDGGRWFTMALFRLFKKPLTKEREEKIQTIGFLTLMLLIVLITLADIGKMT